MAFEDTWAAIAARVATSEFPFDEIGEDEFVAYGTAAIEPLVAKLDAVDLRVALTAGLALAQLRDHAQAIRPYLLARVDDPHPIAARHARFVLRELGDPAAIPDEPIDDELPIPYLGETVRLDGHGPLEREDYGIGLWLEMLQWHAQITDEWDVWDRREWNPAEERAVIIRPWCPDQLAIARVEIIVGAYSFDTDRVVTTALSADESRGFTNQELLWKILDAHHRIAPCNDRIFEGLKREPDGSYYIKTGS